MNSAEYFLYCAIKQRDPKASGHQTHWLKWPRLLCRAIGNYYLRAFLLCVDRQGKQATHKQFGLLKESSETLVPTSQWEMKILNVSNN